MITFEQLNLDNSSECGRWDMFCADTQSAWFWHTTPWLRYQLLYNPKLGSQNFSFTVNQNSKPVAVVPLFVENQEYGKTFTFGGGPLPQAAIDIVTDFPQVMDKINERINLLAYDLKSDYIQIQRSPLCCPNSGQQTEMQPWGYTPIPFQSHVVNILPEQEMRKYMRKGHLSDVKTGLRQLECYVITGDSLYLNEAFSRYITTHYLAAGRVTRPETTFALQMEWIKSGLAMLVGAKHGDRWVGFDYVFLYQSMAYYGSACIDPDYRHFPIGHVLQWKIFEWLYDHDYVVYDMGLPSPYGPLSYDVPTDKQLGIARFKRGFGGKSTTVWRWEKFFTEAAFRRVQQERNEAYAKAVWGWKAASSN